MRDVSFFPGSLCEGRLLFAPGGLSLFWRIVHRQPKRFAIVLFLRPPCPPLPQHSCYSLFFGHQVSIVTGDNEHASILIIQFFLPFLFLCRISAVLLSSCFPISSLLPLIANATHANLLARSTYHHSQHSAGSTLLNSLESFIVST